MKTRWVKGTLTVVGAIAFSTLGIFAADSLQGIQGGIQNFAVPVRQVCVLKVWFRSRLMREYFV
jgi:hypothetical protein